jgi:putative FmdB family regulatory protein
MPFYKYECLECGARFDYLGYAFQARIDVKCPKCSSTNLIQIDVNDTQQSEDFESCETCTAEESS